jgi:hypothetical protein
MAVLACSRLTITPEELWKELEANSDLTDLESGAVSVQALRQVAITLAYACTKTPAKAGLVEGRNEA